MFARRIAMLLGATALAVPGFYASEAQAQLLINASGGNGGNGSGYDGDGGNGGAAGNATGFNDQDRNVSAGAPFFVSAFDVRSNGGNGGHGGYGTIIIGGNGGEGGHGGGARRAEGLNTNSTLTTDGTLHHGMSVAAIGGRGGDGGGSGGIFYADEGDGGNGGAGGTAIGETTASSIIHTRGSISYGLLVDASGGAGGTGGNAVSAGYSNAGEGGNGGNAGDATGINAGSILTEGRFSYGVIVRSTGGKGGDGGSTSALFAGSGANGGPATLGGFASGTNSGRIETLGEGASGLVVQSIGGAGGDGGDGDFGIFYAGGGAGSYGNDGAEARGVNTGTILTSGHNAIGMLIESIGGGGGNGGGAGSVFVSTGGQGNGGGDAGQVFADLGGEIRTGVNSPANGAIGVLIQSVGGGGGNGGYAVSLSSVAAVAIGGSGAAAGHGRAVTVNQAGAGVTVSTAGNSAAGIMVQSVGGGGGNGGGSIAAAGLVSVAVGGSSGIGGDGGAVEYGVGNAQVRTNGVDSTGVLIQSVGGGGGNGGFAVSGAVLASVGIGGSGAGGGIGQNVQATTGGFIETLQDRSAGLIVQSIGGGGGNGGFVVGASVLASVGVGGSGAGGGTSGTVTYNTSSVQDVTTRGADSIGVAIQSIGGGGGNGGFTGNFAGIATVGVGGSGGGGAEAGIVNATYNGTVNTYGPRSSGIVVQSIGGGGGNGGGSFGASGAITVGLGGSGGAGSHAKAVTYDSDISNVTTRREDSAGVIIQSIGGGGGNGGYAVALSAGATVNIGGSGNGGGNGGKVDATIDDGVISTTGDRSSGIIAQSLGGGGGNGGGVASGALALNINLGGSGGGGGSGETVDLTTGADIRTRGVQSHAIFAQSLGGGGGSGGFSLAIGGPSFAIGGQGDLGGRSQKVTVANTGTLRTERDLSHGLLAQSIGGGGGDGGMAMSGALFSAVSVGGSGAAGGVGGDVEVDNTANITTLGALSHGIFAQSVGGGGGNGGSAGAIGVGVFGAAGVAVGGSGGDGGRANTVEVTHDGTIRVSGIGSKGIMAQSVGGGGGNGGSALSGAFSVGLYINANAGVAIGGSGGDGGDAGGQVTVRSNGDIIAETAANGSGGILAQSIGGGGGNGGRVTSLSGGASTNVSVNLGVSVGGEGGAGGTGGAVHVEAGLAGPAQLTTRGDNAVGIMAQSIGGGGGNGGDSWSGGAGFGANVTVSATVSVGGFAGDGQFSGSAYLENNMTVDTFGNQSSAIVAQSIGGGGGNGGASRGNVGSLPGNGVTVNASVSVGGFGGGAADGNIVDVINRGALTTRGDFSSGIIAQSLGGGGGTGGASSANIADLIGGVGSGNSTRIDATVGIGGSGGGGGNAMAVNVTNSGMISTSGFQAYGIMAMAVGGGGGASGSAAAANAGTSLVSVGAAIALPGGNAGNGGTVTVRNNASIFTTGSSAIGISASSIGGGGGVGGSANASAGPEDGVGGGGSVGVTATAAIGGGGGSGGIGLAVRVENGLTSTGLIQTRGVDSHGIVAQSIGGGGGNGGNTWSNAGGSGSSVSISASVAIGGGGGDGNHGGTAYVENNMAVRTFGNNSNAIVAQSIGGGGGNGGSASAQTESGQGKSVTVNAALGIGGSGGGASNGDVVDVINRGALVTTGNFSSGIVAQSIGGGGGIGGASSGKITSDGDEEQEDSTRVDVSLGIGGSGGGGGIGEQVTVNNTGMIVTTGYQSFGIMALSIGGGGGSAGASAAGGNGNATVSIGGAIALAGGSGGKGGIVRVTNNATIITTGDDSFAISASSIGGGGGVGGSSTASANGKVAIGAGIAGPGGGARDGDLVEVRNLSSGVIETYGARAIGVFAQSIGGSGGAGGAGSSTSTGGTVGISLAFAREGSGGGNGGIVNVDNYGRISTFREYAHGVMAQSVGGGGGVGGAAGAGTDGENVNIGIAMGGLGGGGGSSSKVTVSNFGIITTEGNNAYGVFAQSVGGGGGAAGAGSTETTSGSVGVNLSLGGIGGAGSDGGEVEVVNVGRIQTLGALAHGIFAQSVGGGGGASGSASNASSAETSIGIQTGLGAGIGADGKLVTVDNSGIIETYGNGALGIFAQSVGGGGGYGGVVSDDSASDGAFTVNVGGIGASGGNGGDVMVDVSGTIITHGARAHGVVAQSVGGSGGYGGDANGKTGAQLAIGGTGGGGGDGGDVTVIRTGEIITYGVDSIAIIAQSTGGGGGYGGAGFGRFTTSDNGGGPNSIGFQTPGGATGEGGVVTIIQTGAIETTGNRAHGIVAQAVAGGGGLGGASSLASGQSGAGSVGGIGNAQVASATANDQIRVAGAQSYALFGQSAAGQGNSSAVTLTAMSNLFAQGADSVAAYGESTASGTKGNIIMNLNGAYTIGGSATGVAAMLVGGADNAINNHSLLYAMGHDYDFAYVGGLPTGPVPLNAILGSLLDDFSPMSITGTGGNDTVNNNRTAGGLGRIIGNIDLGGGINAFNNGLNSSMVALEAIDLGGGLYTNHGLYTNKGVGIVETVDITGGFTQTATGEFVTDLDLNTQTNDNIALLGPGADGSFTGEAPLNFLSIDRLFDEYRLARGETMALTGAGLDPVFRSTVGFDFKTRVDFGTDLILYADKPTFEDLINDPASGVTDNGAVQMAQYMDGLEGVMSPDDPASELARLVNMLRFLPDMETYGETMMRLTPHYAVHTYELTNRTTDLALESARHCFDSPSAASSGNCAWFTYSPESNYERDSGATASFKQDLIKQLSVGALGGINANWSVGGAFAYSDLRSKVTFKDQELSDTKGENWQLHALAKYSNGAYFADFALGGGAGTFKGQRDTTVDQVESTPGETLEGIYLPDVLLPGIGNSVTYNQNVKQFSVSTRLGYTFEPGNGIYLKPNIQLDGRWINIKGDETGSVVAFRFDGPGNFYYSATPGIEIGADLPISDIASLRIYGKAGVELSSFDWEAHGQFKAAEGLGAPPLKLTEKVDSPLYRLGAGIELNGVNGVGLGLRYSGAFGERVEQQTFSGNLKVKF